jgi:hypothetical protein
MTRTTYEDLLVETLPQVIETHRQLIGIQSLAESMP